jgi:hypothetical protein
MKLKYTVVKNKSYEDEQIKKSIPPPAYVLPPAAIARGKSLPPIFGNNATTYYKPHSLAISGVGTVRNSSRKGFRT